MISREEARQALLNCHEVYRAPNGRTRDRDTILAVVRAYADGELVPKVIENGKSLSVAGIVAAYVDGGLVPISKCPTCNGSKMKLGDPSDHDCHLDDEAACWVDHSTQCDDCGGTGRRPDYEAAYEAMVEWVERRGVPDKHVARAIVIAALGGTDE